jgi:hypothetical protein
MKLREGAGMDVLDWLRMSVGSGEVLKIIYNGGSQPGTSREVLALKIEDGMLFAKCIVSNKQKSFSINKIQIPSDADETPVFHKNVSSLKFQNINQFLDENIKEIEGMGWIIKSNEEEITLYRKLKNGKMGKKVESRLAYEKFYLVPVYSDGGEDILKYEEELRVKPWEVYVKGSRSRYFGSLYKAAVAFIETLRKIQNK